MDEKLLVDDGPAHGTTSGWMN